MCNCKGLLKAINAYIQKADDDLEEQLTAEGYADANLTVEAASELEENIATALKAETALFLADFEDSIDLEVFYSDIWPEIKGADDVDVKLKQAFMDEFQKTMPQFITSYIQDTDTELTLSQMSKRTTAWIEEWSEELGQIMKLNSADEFERILIEGLDEGYSVEKVTRKVMNSGIRDEYYKARRASLTEMLRAHSVARQEGIMQSPAVETKTWVHSGTYKIKPRQNHVDISGQTVPKNQPFTLTGADGHTYNPMYPRDRILPVGETANCHCIHRGNASDDILGMSLEERQELQRQAIEEDDGAWEKELDARNKAKAGINEETIKMDWLKGKTKQGQINYLGSKSRWALVESGVITDDAGLSQLYQTTKISTGKKITTRKTLKSLKKDGIITVSRYKDSSGKLKDPYKHSTEGDFSATKNPKKPAGGKNGGNMTGGGHSQSNIKRLDDKGIAYSVTKTYKNGVRIGGVENHTTPNKRLSQSGQAWFPASWTDDDVLVAGTYVANKPEVTITKYGSSDTVVGYEKYGRYNGVTVGVYVDTENNVGTIFPDAQQRKVGDIK